MDRKKYGWTAKGIVGMIFAPIGLIFLPLGLFLWHYDVMSDPDTEIAHVYYSRYLYTDVSDLLKSEEVPVYIDRMNDKVGFVDIDAVLPEIRVHG